MEKIRKKLTTDLQITVRTWAHNYTTNIAISPPYVLVQKTEDHVLEYQYMHKEYTTSLQYDHPVNINKIKQ